MTDPLDPQTLLARRWPLHGPYSPERAVSAAGVLAELVRYLNYATGQGATRALPHAADVCALLGAFTAAVGGLDQTLHQLRERTEALSTDPTLRHAQHPDDHRAAATDAARAGARLDTARQTAGALYAELAAARSHLTWLAHDEEATP
jgi:hypothetical protein